MFGTERKLFQLRTETNSFLCCDEAQLPCYFIKASYRSIRMTNIVLRYVVYCNTQTDVKF